MERRACIFLRSVRPGRSGLKLNAIPQPLTGKPEIPGFSQNIQYFLIFYKFNITPPASENRSTEHRAPPLDAPGRLERAYPARFLSENSREKRPDHRLRSREENGETTRFHRLPQACSSSCEG